MLRFSASPIGDMHIEDLRVAILTYLIAQQESKPFIIRINDLDKENNIEGKDTEIMQILEKFALTHTSVSHQTEHLHMHQILAIRLLEEGKAFVCTCSSEEIDAERKKAKEKNITYQYSGHCKNLDKAAHQKLKASGKPFVIRIKQPKKAVSNTNIDSFIILNTDSTPSEIFADACDDMMNNIDFIIEKEKYLLNSEKQEYIKSQLGYKESTQYYHLPMIVNDNNTNINTEDNYSVKWFFEQGFLPDALVNYLIALGNPKISHNIFTLPDAIQWFDLQSISSSNVLFDLEKLRFINKEHLNMMDNKSLSTLFGFADESVGKLAKLYLEKACTINELAGKIRPIFAPKVIEKQWENEMKTMQNIIINAPMIHDFNTFKSYIIKESNLDEKTILIPLRLLLTGQDNGPDLDKIYPLIKPYLLEVIS